MEIFKGLIGNEDIKNTLGLAIKNSEFLHAYIIEGPAGTGKRTIARLASASIMCKSTADTPCGRCNSCEKILNDNCADVRFYDAFKVDEVRKIKETLYESATECDHKVYILNDAHKMNIKAQNALLISLEEPPKNVVFFLLCEDASYLLETIRSRAQILRTKPLDNDTILDYVKKNCKTTLSDSSLKEIIVSSGGSLGYVLNMLDEKSAELLLKERDKAKELCVSLLRADSTSLTFISSLFSMQREKLKELLSTCLGVLRDLAVLKKQKDAPLCFFASREEAIQLSAGFHLKKLLSLYDSISRAIDDLNVNASVSNTLISILTK
ncbi:MAG: hypothetical protein IJ309_00785 [Clostridia bacterium]|nr:hypothetical protein [Clostridia bacterium]